MIRSDRAKSNLLLFLLAFTSTFINVVQADQNSLCKLGEEIYFSCAAKGKMISLCGSQDASPADGYLVYRYGQAGALELEYPAGGVSSPSKSFTYGEWSGVVSKPLSHMDSTDTRSTASIGREKIHGKMPASSWRKEANA